MEGILTAAKDLIKYKIISSVNTGDKTYDSSLVLFLTTLLAYLFGKEIWIKIWDYILYRYYIRYINKNTDLKITKVVKAAKYIIKYETDNIGTGYGSYFTGFNYLKLLQYYLKHVETNPGVISISSISSKRDPEAFLYLNCPKSTPIPLFIRNGKIVWMICVASPSGGFVSLSTNCMGIYSQFLLLYNEDKEEVKRKGVISSELGEYELYSDRSFSQVISKHKKDILSVLDNFIHANREQKSKFGGLGSYNFGLILHGSPGTGKTLMIKAICNYLGRNGKIINMRGIKTVKQFFTIFEKEEVKNWVYIFDEFDCVQGILSRELENGTDSNSELKELRDRYIKVLELQNGNSSKEISKELENINNEIASFKDRLTIDTILTVLDGTIEMRGRVIIATTNYIDRIDSALLRPGRFDMKIKLDKFDETEIKEILTFMFKDSGEDLSYLETKKFKGGVYTPAEITNICHIHNDFKKIVDTLSI